MASFRRGVNDRAEYRSSSLASSQERESLSSAAANIYRGTCDIIQKSALFQSSLVILALWESGQALASNPSLPDTLFPPIHSLLMTETCLHYRNGRPPTLEGLLHDSGARGTFWDQLPDLLSTHSSSSSIYVRPMQRVLHILHTALHESVSLHIVLTAIHLLRCSFRVYRFLHFSPAFAEAMEHIVSNHQDWCLNTAMRLSTWISSPEETSLGDATAVALIETAFSIQHWVPPKNAMQSNETRALHHSARVVETVPLVRLVFPELFVDDWGVRCAAPRSINLGCAHPWLSNVFPSWILRLSTDHHACVWCFYKMRDRCWRQWRRRRGLRILQRLAQSCSFTGGWISTPDRSHSCVSSAESPKSSIQVAEMRSVLSDQEASVISHGPLSAETQRRKSLEGTQECHVASALISAASLSHHSVIPLQVHSPHGVGDHRENTDKHNERGSRSSVGKKQHKAGGENFGDAERGRLKAESWYRVSLIIKVFRCWQIYVRNSRKRLRSFTKRSTRARLTRCFCQWRRRWSDRRLHASEEAAQHHILRMQSRNQRILCKDVFNQWKMKFFLVQKRRRILVNFFQMWKAQYQWRACDLLASPLARTQRENIFRVWRIRFDAARAERYYKKSLLSRVCRRLTHALSLRILYRSGRAVLTRKHLQKLWVQWKRRCRWRALGQQCHLAVRSNTLHKAWAYWRRQCEMRQEVRRRETLLLPAAAEYCNRRLAVRYLDRWKLLLLQRVMQRRLEKLRLRCPLQIWHARWRQRCRHYEDEEASAQTWRERSLCRSSFGRWKQCFSARSQQKKFEMENNQIKEAEHYLEIFRLSSCFFGWKLRYICRKQRSTFYPSPSRLVDVWEHRSNCPASARSAYRLPSASTQFSTSYLSKEVSLIKRLVFGVVSSPPPSVAEPLSGTRTQWNGAQPVSCLLADDFSLGIVEREMERGASEADNGLNKSR